MNAWITCEDCGGSGRDTAGHNFAFTGGNYACENCSGEGGWEEATELVAEHQLTETQGDPLKHFEPKRKAA